MRRHSPSLYLLAAAIIAAPAAAQSQVIGVVAPQSGAFEQLGRQIIDGARIAAEKTGTDIRVIEENCEAASGAAIADKLVAEKVEIAIGFLCSESLDGAMPILKPANIPAISLSVRWQVLMEDALKRGWPFYRMAPSATAESEKLTDVILARWPGAAFALIDDGTIRARELSEAIRSRLEERGMKPVFTDTFRPGQENQIALARRLERAGATHVFVGGDRNDISIIARDAQAEDIALTLVGGDAMKAANEPVPLIDGTFAVTLPDYAALPGAAAVVTELREKAVEPEGYVLPAYAAIEVAVEAAKGATDGGVAARLDADTFQTVIGPIGFSQGHELRDNPFALAVWQNGAFVTPAVSQ